MPAATRRANAAWLAEHGAAVALADAELTADRLLAEAGRLRDDAIRAPMAAAARQLGRPNAAEDIARALLDLADAA